MKSSTSLPGCTSEMKARVDLYLTMVRDQIMNAIDSNPLENYCYGPEITQVGLIEMNDIVLAMVSENDNATVVEGLDMAAKMIKLIAHFAVANDVELFTTTRAVA